MKIGVKFCGGCNETFSRVDALNRIKKNLPQHNFEPFFNKKKYDLVLVICGCLASCASQITIYPEVERYIISELNAVDDAILHLQNYL